MYLAEKGFRNVNIFSLFSCAAAEMCNLVAYYNCVNLLNL